jgi:hypothetical protein
VLNIALIGFYKKLKLEAVIANIAIDIKEGEHAPLNITLYPEPI